MNPLKPAPAAGKPPARAHPAKSFALALGGGGARALANISVLEALDELGQRPVAVAGTSLGAAIGAAYCAGMSGKDIRRHVIAFAHDRGATFSRLISARARPLAGWLRAPFGNPMLVDGKKLCERFLPEAVPHDFHKLQTPLIVVATDLYERSEMVFARGALRPAVAASMAIPGLVRPVEVDGRVLVDGSAVNPVPFDHLRGRADLVVAVDCSGGPTEPRGIPDPWESLFATLQVMGQSIVSEKLKAGAPDLLLRPRVGTFRLLDFFHASAILRAAEPVKEEVETMLGALLAE